LLAAILLNGTHGHKLTREEVRKAIHKAMRDPVLKVMSNTQLAARIGTSNKTVERAWDELANVKSTKAELVEPELNRYMTKDGKTVTRKAHNKKSKNRPAPAWLNDFKAAAKAVPADHELTLLEDGLVAAISDVAEIAATAAERLIKAAAKRKPHLKLANPEVQAADQVVADASATENVEVCR